MAGLSLSMTRTVAAVYDRRIFASLTLGQDRVVVASRNGGLKIDPGPMHRTGRATAVLGFAFAQAHGLAL